MGTDLVHRYSQVAALWRLGRGAYSEADSAP